MAVPANPSVLIVDSDQACLKRLVPALAGLGYNVDVAANGLAALVFSQRQHYTLAFLGHDLPEDVLELFRKLRETQQHVVAVLLTAATDLDTVHAAIDAGMRSVLPKPVDLEELRAVIDDTESSRLGPALDERRIAALSVNEINHSPNFALARIIRSVEFPFAGKARLEYFDRDTLLRVAHLVRRWCASRLATVAPPSQSLSLS